MSTTKKYGLKYIHTKKKEKEKTRQCNVMTKPARVRMQSFAALQCIAFRKAAHYLQTVVVFRVLTIDGTAFSRLKLSQYVTDA